MTHLSVQEAADSLGVHPSRVRSLLSAGQLAGRRIGSVWVVNTAALERRRAAVAGMRGRSLSTRVSWAAGALLDGQATPWLKSSERSRLRTRLSHHDQEEAQIFRWWLQSRASMTRFRISKTDITELLSNQDVVMGGISGASAYSAGIGHGTEAEIYVTHTKARQLVDEFFLLEDPQGNLVIHKVDDTEQWHLVTARTIEGVSVTPRLVVAVDLLESEDTRSRTAGATLLRRTLADTYEHR
ncbi:helix-turn-helix domain-containing protein [Amycolatopsis sp. cg5]|uniref:helix-turn-helix domain-containing protein n=1 Tax=Amycolatopsis sp. cg5 TaxID=3238802 RepID=UPI003525DA0E